MIGYQATVQMKFPLGRARAGATPLEPTLQNLTARPRQPSRNRRCDGDPVRDEARYRSSRKAAPRDGSSNDSKDGSLLPRLIAGLAELAGRYDVILCDVWGVVHNGAAAFAPALDALARFRAKGGAVALITNSPAPSRIVQAQLDSFGAPRAAYDAIVSSGDVTVSLLIERAGQSLFHIGAAAETGLFDEVAAVLGARRAKSQSSAPTLCFAPASSISGAKRRKTMTRA